MTKIYRSLTDLIGNTPLLELTNYNRKFAPQATIIAKLEYFNPAGSAKDRIAMAMIDAAGDCCKKIRSSSNRPAVIQVSAWPA